MRLQIQQLLERAAERHTAGDLAGSEQHYRAVLALDPDEALALAGMGALAGQRGDAREAADYLGRACRLAPANALVHHNHGEALRQLGQWREAEAALRRALELDQGLVPAWVSLGALAHTLHAQAVSQGDTQRAQSMTREMASLLNNQGNAWLGRGGGAEAVRCYRRAIALRADYATAWSNLGNCLRGEGQLSEAEASCRQAVALAPEMAEAWNNLGNTLVEQARFDEAAPCYDKALALRPGFAEAVHNRGSGSLFNRLYSVEPSYAEIAQQHRSWGAVFPKPERRHWPHDRRPERVLRIGYLSADLREHAMRHFIEPLLARHDARQVEVVCYAQGPVADTHTRRLAGYGHRWHWVHGLDDAGLAALVERDAIDILVDCMGHTHGTRISALAGKPAPVMASWLGYLCTTGLPAMDYRLSDEWVDPPDHPSPPDTEEVLRIPGGMLAYRPHANAPDALAPPSTRNGWLTFGSLNNVQKINRTVVARWAELLQAVPHSRLLLKSKLLADPGTVGRLRGLFEAFGIPPARLDLRPASRDFLQTYQEIDIALDTFPYGGGVTTCDALWMGVPVVSLAGQRPAGRLSLSLLQRIGHAGWVADTGAAYRDKAIALAGDLPALAALRAGLRTQVQASSLCDEAGFVRQLEGVYRGMWKRWLAANAA